MAQKPNATTLLQELKNKGIGAEAYYVNPVHQMPFYRKLWQPQTPRN